MIAKPVTIQIVAHATTIIACKKSSANSMGNSMKPHGHDETISFVANVTRLFNWSFTLLPSAMGGRNKWIMYPFNSDRTVSQQCSWIEFSIREKYVKFSLFTKSCPSMTDRWK